MSDAVTPDAGDSRDRQILDSAVDHAVIATDRDGRVTRWSEGARRVLGWTEAEMLGESADRIFTPEDVAAGRPAEERRGALATGDAADERWHLRRRGERFWASGKLTVLRDAHGAAAGFVKVLRDRTDRRLAEEAVGAAAAELRETRAALVVEREQLAQMFEQAPTFMAILRGPEHRFERVNAGYRRLVGGREVVGHPVRDALPEAVGQGFIDLLDEVFRSGRAFEARGTLFQREATPVAPAETRYLDFVYQPLRDPSGVVGGIFVEGADVTDRVLAEQALAASERQFRDLAQALPNQVWTARADGFVDWLNDRVVEYGGHSSDVLVKAGWTTIVHPDDRERAGRRWAGSLASGEDYETEFRIRRADGTYRWHLVRALPTRAADGRVLRWVGTNTDVHDRKLAADETRQDRDRLWELSGDLMLVCDLAGLITAVNPSATRLLGWSPGDMAGRSIGDFIHPDDLAVTTERIGRLRAGESAWAFENRYRTSDGGYRRLQWSAVPDAGRIHAVGRDITAEIEAAEQLRLTEEALRQSQKMEVVGQLTGGIAHDFNNLLQGITGSLEIIGRRVAQGRAAEIDRFIAGATAAANRAAALTHRLLAFSRRQPLDPRAVRANPLVLSMEDLLRRTIGETIALELVMADGLWLTLCDPNQLENAILNLAINARDAMPAGGRLVIGTGNAAIEDARAGDVAPGDYVRLSVTDTGIGMDASTVARAFEPFFTTKPIGQGTGLGLSMIYGFARQSEGYAKIHSEPGRGTTVKLYLPRHRGPAEAAEHEPEQHPAPVADAGEVVLVVEDEAVVRGLIAETLAELGYRALEAADGPEGLALLRSGQRIDLLVTDIGLPGLNGREVAEAARALRPQLGVLFMTGYAENAALASGFLEPGMAMITKPFAMDALATRIRAMVEAGRGR